MEFAEERISSGWGSDRDRPLVLAEEGVELTPSDEEPLAEVRDRLHREDLERAAAAARRAEQASTNARSVRRAVAEDAEAIAARSEELGYPSAFPERVAGRLATVLADADQTVLVAGGEVVAWVQAAEVRSLVSDPCAEIRGLVVAEHHRGHGLGRALVDAAAAWGRGRGLAQLRLRTNVDRTEAQAFYAHLGFEEGKTQHVLTRRL